MRETPRALAAYVAYRDLGPQRSLSKLGQTVGKPSVRRLEVWSAAHNWQARVLDHDRALAAEDARRADQERLDELAKRRAALKAMGLELQRHGLATVRRAAEQGTITPSQAVALIKLGSDLLHRALGEPDWTISHGIGIDLHVDLATLSDDELDERIHRLRLLSNPHRHA
jgi:hypothetical protein